VSFARPEVFWALLLLPLIAIVMLGAYGRGKNDLLRLGGAWRASPLLSIYLLKSFFQALLLLVAFFCLVVAWSGPAWGTRTVAEHQDGLDVALVFDVSWSMTATDVPPNRLGQGIEAARFLVRTFPHTQFSLVAFKGKARTLTPLTTDTDFLDNWLNELGPSVASGPGSDLAAGLREGLRSLDTPTNHHKAVILFSDGEARGGDTVAAARSLAAHGISLFAFGLGTNAGSTIPEGKGALVDDFGFTVITHRNSDLLRAITEETGGVYYPSANRENLSDLQGRLVSLANPASRGGVKLESVQQYPLFLNLALLSLFACLLIRILPWRRLF
jgi:Ca-activated chloride channel family protein